MYNNYDHELMKDWKKDYDKYKKYNIFHLENILFNRSFNDLFDLIKDYISDNTKRLKYEDIIMLISRMKDVAKDNEVFIKELEMCGMYSLGSTMKDQSNRNNVNIVCDNCKFQNCKTCEWKDVELKDLSVFDYMRHILDIPDVPDAEVKKQRREYIKDFCKDFYSQRQELYDE